jgi:hypothetical protein
MTTWRKSSYSGSEANCVEVGAIPWRKSSYSGSEADCVEVGAIPWRKSSYSGSQADCVEAGNVAGRVTVRDTKDRQGRVLSVSPDAWRQFMTGIKG